MVFSTPNTSPTTSRPATYTMDRRSVNPVPNRSPLTTYSTSSTAPLTINTLVNFSCPTLSSSRSEEHTSELQSLAYLVCRLLLEKKKKKQKQSIIYIM